MRASSPAAVGDILDWATSNHSSPIVSRSSSGISGDADSVPAVSVSLEMPGILRASAFASSIAFSVKPPRLATCSYALSRTALEAWTMATTAPKPLAGANSLSSVAPGGAIWILAASAPSGMSRMPRTKASDDSLSARTATFFFFSSASDLIFLFPPEQQHEIVLEDRERARPQRHLGVGAQHREVGLLAVELGDRLDVVGVVDDLDPEARGVVLQDASELGCELRLVAVGGADRKGQRLRIVHQHAAAPDGGKRQQQGQHDVEEDLLLIGLDHLGSPGRWLDRR